MRSTRGHRDDFLMPLTAIPAIHAQHIAHSTDALQHIRNIAGDADRRKDPSGDLAAFDLMPVVTGDLNTPALGVLHTGGALIQVDSLIDLGKHFVKRGSARGKEGIAHASVGFAAVILSTAVCGTRDPKDRRRIAVGNAPAKHPLLHDLSRARYLTFI